MVQQKQQYRITKIINKLKMEMYEYPKYKKMLENNEIKNLRIYERVIQIVEAIEEALDIFGSSDSRIRKVEMIKKHYFHRPLISVVELALEFHYSYSNMQKYELEFFKILGDILGYID